MARPVLLVDNYSSFTFNLFQYLAEVAGVAPLVLPNDYQGKLPLEEVSGAVLSPGPGSPERPGDFGICDAVLDCHELPVLGVCLGHQGIGTRAGARLRRSSLPFHGRSSSILHNGDPIFHGIPQSFQAVRYHSLELEAPLPPELACLAETDDHIVMALRHLGRPHWGVQFHPESVDTEHGKRLLANFCRLADANNSQAQPSTATSVAMSSTPAATPASKAQPGVGAQQAPAAASAPARWQLQTAGLDCRLCPEDLFSAVYGQSSCAFWLDGASAEGLSYMGDGSGPDSFVLRYSQDEKLVQYQGAHKGDRPCDSIFSLLAKELSANTVSGDHVPWSFVGGFVGYFGYELKTEVGASTAHRSHLPDAHWLWADRFVVYDHLRKSYTLAMLQDVGSDKAALAGWHQELEARLAASPNKRDVPLSAQVLLPTGESDEAYIEKIRHCQSRIAEGESYELCLTSQLRVEAEVDAYRLFQILRRQNPAPYSAFLCCSEFSIVSASPERFMKVSRDGEVSSKPIKGTAARDSDLKKDHLLARALERDEKERAENLMIVDLVRNDLGRNCEVGSVVVDKFADLESFPTVHQLVSTIVGQLRADVTALESVRSAFPGGSMTGAPKLRSMEILDALEGRARGPYSGSIGYLSGDGAVDLSIVIRSIVVEEAQVTLGVGGAITALSTPADELAEIHLKARAQLAALQALFE